MAQYSFKGTADMSAHNEAIRKAADEVKAYESTVKDAAETVEGFADAERVSTKELLNQLSQLESVGRKSSDFQRQLGQVTKQIQDLTICYTKLTDEEKSSPLGQATAKRIAELTDIAQEYKETLDGVREQMGGSAPDIEKWDMAAEAIHAVTDSIGAYVAISEFNETQQEKLIQTLTMLSRIEAIGNAVVSAGTTFRNVFAQVEKVRAIQIKAATAATVLQTKATGKATIAQRAFNLVAKANPYVLLATVLITAAVAVGTFVKKMADAREEQEKANEEAERTAERMEKISDVVGDVVGDYRILQTQWQQLTSEQEKAKWIEENKSKFEQLGISIRNAADADKAFVSGSQAVINMLMARAKAEAAAELYKEAVKEDIKNDLNPTAENGRVVTGLKKAGDVISDGDISKAGLRKGIDYTSEERVMFAHDMPIRTVHHRLTKEGEKTFTKYRQTVADNLKAASSSAKEYEQKMIDAAQEAAKATAEVEKLGIANKTTPTGGGTGNTVKTPTKEQLTILEGYNKELQTLKKQQENINPLTLNTEEGKKKVEELVKLINEKEKQISDYKLAVGIDKPKVEEVKKEVKGTLEILQDELKALEEQRVKIDITAPNVDETIKELIDKISAKELEISNLRVKLGIDVPEKEIEEAIPEKTISDKLRNISDNINGITDPIYNVTGAWESFNQACEDGNVLGVFSALTDAITTTIESFAGIIEMMNLFKATSQAAQAVENANSQQKLANDQAEIASSMAKTTANSGEAITEATKSGAKLPFPANIAAIAAGVAAVVAALAMISRFAGGGIVKGKTTVGDMNLARVNGGEMILNNRQQGNLFKLLNGTVGAGQSAPAGNVEFKIKGDTLYGVLKNHTKISSKSGKNISL